VRDSRITAPVLGDEPGSLEAPSEFWVLLWLSASSLQIDVRHSLQTTSSAAAVAASSDVEAITRALHPYAG
jgi:hypothetical protein